MRTFHARPVERMYTLSLSNGSLSIREIDKKLYYLIKYFKINFIINIIKT
jgi:hypothetical protein